MFMRPESDHSATILLFINDNTLYTVKKLEAIPTVDDAD
jgi:hypothetical protein